MIASPCSDAVLHHRDIYLYLDGYTVIADIKKKIKIKKKTST